MNSLVVFSLVLFVSSSMGQFTKMPNSSLQDTKTLKWNDALYWGPLSFPARITIDDLKMSANSNWGSDTPAFDVYLFTAAEFAKYQQNTMATPTYSPYALTSTRVTSTYTPVVSPLTDYVLPADSTTDYYFVIDNRSNAPGRNPPAGATVAISWKKIEFVTQNVHALTDTCGQRVVHTGPGQYAAYEFPNSNGPAMKLFARFSAVTLTGSASPTAFILNRQAFDVLKNGGGGNSQTECQQNTLCGVNSVPGSGPYYFVLYARNTGVVDFSNYKIGAFAEQNDCRTNPSTSTTTTAISFPTNAPTPSPTPGGAVQTNAPTPAPAQTTSLIVQTNAPTPVAGVQTNAPTPAPSTTSVAETDNSLTTRDTLTGESLTDGSVTATQTTSTISGATVSDATQTNNECERGTELCACIDKNCLTGLECSASDVCAKKGCDRGTLNCSCIDEQCLPDLLCVEDICVESTVTSASAINLCIYVVSCIIVAWL